MDHEVLLSSAILLKMDQPQNATTLPAEHYRRKAAEARRAAEGVTTRAILHEVRKQRCWHQ